MRTERGQALVELAVGMFAFALVVSVLTTFAVVIVRGLELQNSLRVGASVRTTSVEVSDFAAQTFTGSSVLHLRESVVFPLTVL